MASQKQAGFWYLHSPMLTLVKLLNILVLIQSYEVRKTQGNGSGRFCNSKDLCKNYYILPLTLHSNNIPTKIFKILPRPSLSF